MDDDREIDDILNFKKRKSKAKGKPKGKRVELEIVNFFNEQFAEILKANPDWGAFSRSIGSGNRWGQKVNLSKSAKNTFSGDITCPDNFKFSIECKGGYNDIDLNGAFGFRLKELDAFLEQAEGDAKRSDKKPLLIWKKDRKPKIAFIKNIEQFIFTKEQGTLMFYHGWVGLSLESLCKLPPAFFFDNYEIKH